MKPYLKGFHLSFETWRGGRDHKGWKAKPRSTVKENAPPIATMEEIKCTLLNETASRAVTGGGPPGGFTLVIPKVQGRSRSPDPPDCMERPTKRRVRNPKSLTAFYGFGDASAAGFGATIERSDGLHGCFGLWGRDKKGQSSNYRELQNLVEMVEEEAESGYLINGELWIFTDNSMAESCFFKGGSSSKFLHELILHLRRLEMAVGFVIHMVYVAGTRMIAQGTDGLSRGSFLEGVVAGQDMLSFDNLA